MPTSRPRRWGVTEALPRGRPGVLRGTGQLRRREQCGGRCKGKAALRSCAGVGTVGSPPAPPGRKANHTTQTPEKTHLTVHVCGGDGGEAGVTVMGR